MMPLARKTPYRVTEGVRMANQDLELIDKIILDAEAQLEYDRGTKNPLDAMTTTINLLGRKYESLVSEKQALDICTKYDKSKTAYQIDKVRDSVRECLELLFETELELNCLEARLEGKR